jgi:hypothetical protein
MKTSPAKTSLANRWLGAITAVAIVVLGAGPAVAAQAPVEVPGEVVVVSVLADGAIVLDGDLGDWATLPTVVTNAGPTPPADPANSGQMRWQVAADQNTLFFAATITDDMIIAGQNGDHYWNEDSIELYLNLSGDTAASAYGPGVGQVTISAIDRGNTDPEMLTLSGSGAPQFDVNGFVFSTTAGWGLEIAVGLNDFVDVVSGDEFGIQVQANGSSGGDRDLKLSWSAADVNDTSFQDPSVFGSAVFFDEATVPILTEDAVPETDTASADAAVDDGETAISDNATAEIGPTTTTTPDTEPKPGRTLLIAAVFSATSILIGGLWFENRRKKSEERLAIGTGEEQDPEPASGEGDDADDDAEFNELLGSILDD